MKIHTINQSPRSSQQLKKFEHTVHRRRSGEQLREESEGGSAATGGALHCACTAQFCCGATVAALMYVSWCGERRNRRVQIRGCCCCSGVCVGMPGRGAFSPVWLCRRLLPLGRWGCRAGPPFLVPCLRSVVAGLQRASDTGASLRRRPRRQRPEQPFCRVPQLRELGNI